MNKRSPELPPQSVYTVRPNLNNELAKARNRAAAERTLMAWMRTCLALISFGFGIDQIVAAVNQSQGIESSGRFGLSRIVGLCFVALGTYAMFAAMLEHRRELRLIRREDYVYVPGRSLSLSISLALMAIGLLTTVVLALKLFLNG
ncbi:MAG: DUF202 domain-containing protein [Cyanobacteria bacterium P01_A01_bin.123]